MDVILIKQRRGGSGKKYPVRYSKKNLDRFGMPKTNGWTYKLASEEEVLQYAAQLGMKLTKKKEKKEEEQA